MVWGSWHYLGPRHHPATGWPCDMVTYLLLTALPGMWQSLAPRGHLFLPSLWVLRWGSREWRNNPITVSSISEDVQSSLGILRGLVPGPPVEIKNLWKLRSLSLPAEPVDFAPMESAFADSANPVCCWLDPQMQNPWIARANCTGKSVLFLKWKNLQLLYIHGTFGGRGEQEQTAWIELARLPQRSWFGKTCVVSPTHFTCLKK